MTSASELFIYEREKQTLDKAREDKAMNIPLKEYSKDRIPKHEDVNEEIDQMIDDDMNDDFQEQIFEREEGL
jgi:hypothetical protein